RTRRPPFASGRILPFLMKVAQPSADAAPLNTNPAPNARTTNADPRGALRRTSAAQGADVQRGRRSSSRVTPLPALTTAYPAAVRVRASPTPYATTSSSPNQAWPSAAAPTSTTTADGLG